MVKFINPTDKITGREWKCYPEVIDLCNMNTNDNIVATLGYVGIPTMHGKIIIYSHNRSSIIGQELEKDEEYIVFKCKLDRKDITQELIDLFSLLHVNTGENLTLHNIDYQKIKVKRTKYNVIRKKKFLNHILSVMESHGNVDTIENLFKNKYDSYDRDGNFIEVEEWNRKFIDIQEEFEKPEKDETLISYSEEYYFDEVDSNNAIVSFQTTVSSIETNKENFLKIFELISKCCQSFDSYLFDYLFKSPNRFKN